MALVIKCLLTLLALSLICKLNVADLALGADSGTVFIGGLMWITARVPLIALAHMLAFY